MRKKLLVALLLFSLAINGCKAIPSYHVVRSAPHKDAIHLEVYLPDRASPATYRRIALDEVRRLRGRVEGTDLPLYEVRLDFIRRDPGGDRLARIEVFLTAPGGDPLALSPRLETILY